MIKEEPKVLTRMRLSCCWGDNLNEKELNEIVDYINSLQQENEQLKKRIDNQEFLLISQGKELKELYSIINEATEYLEHERFKKKILLGLYEKKYMKSIFNHLLKILRGDSNE